ncbi:Protein of unknown function [Leuconostoc citreum]|nr:Protein of unknown function [Leuconostoc citreum LBAE C10]CCF26558.1 Protein of unknown function [Leuconostoc citreum LBAE C11]CCF29066.1 Protein of unknown function [Leuconostoc citreum LBAE E16]CDX65491.1 Protein of unknown function [Leuconostoc citreum]CDX67261.1 Protein of unknown function [Leuconostoc citreum]
MTQSKLFEFDISLAGIL